MKFFWVQQFLLESSPYFYSPKKLIKTSFLFNLLTLTFFQNVEEMHYRISRESDKKNKTKIALARLEIISEKRGMTFDPKLGSYERKLFKKPITDQKYQ